MGQKQLSGDEDFSKPLLQDQHGQEQQVCQGDSITLQVEEDQDDGHQDSKLEWCTHWALSTDQMAELPLVSSVDPFLNHTHDVRGAWELVKLILCSPLLLLRLVLIGLILGIGYLCTKLALCGWEQSSTAMPYWRRRIMWVTRLCARGILFCHGFHWIDRIGRPASREVAPIIVSNHVSYIDPMFYFYELFPTIVSSSSHNDRIFVGTIIRSMQVILVDRLSSSSRKAAIAEIKRRAETSDFPPVLLFPEATTTNGRALISFKPGAFVPGFPVQPVVVRYPHVHFDVSWGNISLLRLLPRMLLQLHNFMQVQYLPVIFPSSWEKAHPADFAQRVRTTMARALNVPETEHSYGDLMISSKVTELKLRASNSYALEMFKMEKQLGFTESDAIYYLEKFARMNTSRSGSLTKAEFLQSMGLPSSSFGDQVPFFIAALTFILYFISRVNAHRGLFDQIFGFFDRRDHGFVTFQEFVLATICLSRHEPFTRLLALTLNSLDADNHEVVSLDEIEKRLSSTFSETATQKLVALLSAEGESFDAFKRQLQKNPELVFPLALAIT